ncbi:Nn.00g058310.m01.CDS01 [Neocucurbitaria sp. VM-36]
MAKPTILIVPGSFAPPTIYSDVVSLLQKQGYPALALQLPSTQKRMPLEPATMQDDANDIRQAVTTLLSLGREVIVLCHSYGGTPTTEALAGLDVKRIIYLTAAVPKVGQTHIDAMETGEAAMPESTGGYMHISALAMTGAIADDLPWEQAYPLALQLSHHSAISFRGAVTQVAYESIPVSYVVCEKDFIIPPETQRRFIKMAEEGSGRKVDVKSLDCGHCPNWTMPEKLVEVVVGIAGE